MQPGPDVTEFTAVRAKTKVSPSDASESHIQELFLRLLISRLISKSWANPEDKWEGDGMQEGERGKGGKKEGRKRREEENNHVS